jgi:hypothetical protein
MRCMYEACRAYIRNSQAYCRSVQVGIMAGKVREQLRPKQGKARQGKARQGEGSTEKA